MIHSGRASLKGDSDRSEYAEGYRARLTAIPDYEGAHHYWRVGWEDTDTEVLELACHKQAIAAAGKTTTLTRRVCSSMPGAMRGSMSFPSMSTERLREKRAGSNPISTSGCMGWKENEERRSIRDVLWMWQ
jgi:hypothetical protein